MSFPLSREEDTILVAAAALDKEVDKLDRRERYQREKDAKYGVSSVEYLQDMASSDVDTAKYAIDRAMYWDELRSLDRESALVLVLRYCLGYSAAEIAAGLGLSYAKVKYRCRVRA